MIIMNSVMNIVSIDDISVSFDNNSLPFRTRQLWQKVRDANNRRKTKEEEEWQENKKNKRQKKK